jgi:hypothetical protein
MHAFLRVRRAIGNRRGLGVIASILLACGRTPTPMTVHCGPGWEGCACFVEISSDAQTSPVACNPTAFPGTTCCAEPGWPSLATTCSCDTDEIYCGIVPGYFTDATSGCVCAPHPQSAGEQPGLTCYPGASTMQATLGICCMFPNGQCACGAGLHTCGMGGSEVTTCSAANFPPPSHTCPAGKTTVASCSEQDAGLPGDFGISAQGDAMPFGSCSSNADCDPTFQFCQKTSCDSAAMGTCATRPGQRATFYCSADVGGGPVCGCDGQTWGYGCLANAEGINVASPGPCAAFDGGAG